MYMYRVDQLRRIQQYIIHVRVACLELHYVRALT